MLYGYACRFEIRVMRMKICRSLSVPTETCEVDRCS